MLAKVSKRGGQNKRQDAPRKPCGAIDYAADKRRRARLREVEDVRMRVHGLHRHQAGSEKASTVFGRMYLQGEFGEIGKGGAEAIYEAGEEFLRRQRANLAAISAPRAPKSGSDLGIVQERTGKDEASTEAVPVRLTEAEYAERCVRARRRYAEIRRVCLLADPHGLFALETIVVEDKMAESLVGPLRVACNAIARMMQGAGSVSV